MLNCLHVGMASSHPCNVMTKAKPCDAVIQRGSRESRAVGFARTQARFTFMGSHVLLSARISDLLQYGICMCLDCSVLVKKFIPKEFKIKGL